MKLIPNIYKIEYNIVLFIVTAFFGLVISFYQYTSIKQQLNNNLEVQNIHMHKVFNLSIKKLQNELELKSNGIININGVKEAFLNKEREKLYSLIKKPYTQISQHNKYLKIVTFRLLDGSAFLRVHKPSMHGDQLNQKRKIILDTINLKKRQHGFEVGKLKMTYRVVTPIIYKGKLLGVMEMGVEPEYLTDYLDAVFNTKMALLVQKEDLSININAKEIQKIKNFSFVRGDNLFKEQIKNIDLDKTNTKIVYNNSEYSINTSFNLNDNKNNIAAKLLIAYNLDSFNEKVSNLIQINLIITVCLFIFLLFGFNLFTKKIRKTHEAIRKKDDILAVQSRMASMGEMLESIAHQWRQPLSLISTTSSGMQVQKEHGILSDEDLIKNLESINTATEHLSQTIDDFRNFYKQDKKAHQFNLKEAIEKSLQLVSSQLKSRDIKIINKIKDTTVVGFENELIQVFLNIINNSKDQLEDLKVQNRVIQISLKKSNNKVNIFFQDNAGGINEEILPNIFDHKFTTKSHKNGTGIGLYMSKLIVKKSQGFIKAENKNMLYKNKTYNGACFTIELPTE